MSACPPEGEPALAGARAAHEAFDSYQTWFRIITRRAQMRFENRDWHGMQSDASERLGLYRQVLDPLVTLIRRSLGPRIGEKSLWTAMKAVYSGLIEDRRDRELAETFFNSLTRRIFTTVGVDPEVEFVDSDFVHPPQPADPPVFRAYRGNGNLAALSAAILTDCGFQKEFENLQRDAELAEQEISRRLRAAGLPSQPDRLEMIRSVFYRGKGAYVVGKVCSGEEELPLAFCLLNPDGGIVVDAVLMNEDEVSILFSFTRSYFHIHMDQAHALVQFLKSIMPRKPVSELYNSVGCNKHGKTELFRDLLRHLAATNDLFEAAPGARGMVMAVFTLPSFEVVFKIIKDSFDYPKKSTREEVMEKYRLVFAHDRAGRLVDAQEFEHLQFDRARFSPPLLDELQKSAKETVIVNHDSVVIKHLYTERRLTPLDVYLQAAGPEAIGAAVVDFGNAIKDLARANIFTGDVLAKNFGVTRHGRIVSYDYDELCLLTDCNFRDMPAARSMDEELADEPWFYVAENDYFPEEFESFFGLAGPWRALFRNHHADLFRTDFWQQIQRRIQAGELIHIFPYPPDRRLAIP